MTVAMLYCRITKSGHEQCAFVLMMLVHHCTSMQLSRQRSAEEAPRHMRPARQQQAMQRRLRCSPTPRTYSPRTTLTVHRREAEP